MGVNEGDLQDLIDVDVILEKYYVDCKYKATTWCLKKNRNAPRPSEHPLVKTNRGNVAHHQAWYYRNGKTFCFRSKRVDRCVGVEHEEYLEAVDLTSCVGTIPTWLASYFLV